MNHFDAISNNLKKYESVERWFSHVFSSGIRSKSTEKTYIHFLGRFCSFMNLDPDKLIDVRREQLKDTNILIQRQMEEKVKKWRNYLEQEKNLARASVVTASNTIKSFFHANFVPLTLKSPTVWASTERKTPTNKELTKMVEKAKNDRNRAIIVGLAQTGTSIEDFLELVTYNRVQDELERGVEPLHLPMIREKVKKHYDTFLGLDAINYLSKYLKDTTIKPEQPIFKLGIRTVEYMVKKVSIRAGLTPHVTPHCMRKFFHTFLSLSFHGSQSNHIPIVDYWMGHTDRYKGAYMVPPVDGVELSQRKLYKDHEWAISLEH